MKQCNDFGQKPSGDMSPAASAASGKGKPEQIGKSVTPAQPGKPAAGEMGKVRNLANKK